MSIVTDPIFELSGHVGSLVSKRIALGSGNPVPISPICDSEQPPSPDADDGFTRTPGGSVTTAFFRSPSPICVGSSLCGSETSNVNADGWPATSDVGLASMVGVKGTFSQPSVPACAPQSSCG